MALPANLEDEDLRHPLQHVEVPVVEVLDKLVGGHELAVVAAEVVVGGAGAPVAVRRHHHEQALHARQHLVQRPQRAHQFL